MIPNVLGSFASLRRPHRPTPVKMSFFLLPVEEKTPPEASTCSKPQRQGRGVGIWVAPALYPLPVNEKAILGNTPNKRACDGHFPLPVKGKAIPSHRALRSPTALQSTAEPHVHPSHGALPHHAGILILDWQGEKWIAGTPGRPFPRQAKRKGTRKRAPCSHDCRFLDRQGGNGIASTGHVPTTAFSSTMVTSKLGRSAAVPRGKLVPSPEGARN